MEVAIALGLPVGFYKINNDNLNLLKPPLKNCDQGSKENTETEKNEKPKVDSEELFPESQDQEKQQTPLFHDKEDLWEGDKTEKKLEENSFWLENKVEDSDAWHHSQDSMKTLATKFEPNLSSKLLESSNDSIDDGKYEGPVQLIDLDSNSKDVEQSNSSENLDGSPNMVKDHGKMPDISRKHPSEEKSSLWNENSADKESAELWNENSEREKWDETSGIVRTKSTSELWTTDNSDMPTPNEKPASNLWNENSNLTGSEKVDDTNSEFLDSLLSVPNSNEFLANESGNFLSENITLMNDKNEELKSNESVRESKEKNEWRNDGDDNNYMRVWDTGKNPSWPKEESILSGGLQDRMPGVRTTGRLTSTPETNGNMSFSISNRRNSISDFSNINLESANLDMVLPSAKTLIKDCLKNDEGKFEMKEGSFLEGSDNYKVKNWGEGSEKPDFSSANVNSEDLMKMALESLTSQHDVINVPATSFDSAIGILNQNQESGNLNLFTTSETDGLDFNLPLPDHLLRTNFASSNFQTGCEQHSTNNFQNSDSPTFLSTTSNIFGTTCTLSNSIKFDQFDTNFTNKKSKSLDDVIEFFDSKTSFNGYEGGGGGSPNINNFPFGSDPTHGDGYSVPETLVASEDQSKKKKSRSKKPIQKRSQKMLKKIKNKKTASMDYPKTKTIESIINEALFESCASTGKPLQMQDSSPNGNSTIQNASENYSLPIISGSLDEVENLDFLSQD